MPLFKKLAATAAFTAASAGFAAAALAAKPEAWGIGMQPSVSPYMDQVVDFHTLLNVIIGAVTAFVLGLLAWVMFRYREKANPNPSRTTHNTLIEIIWTVVPVAILVVIAVPSFRLLYTADNAGHELPITIKARGHQWNWSYVYLNSLKLGANGKVVDASGKALIWNSDTGKYTNGLPVETLSTRFFFGSSILCKTDAECVEAQTTRKMNRKPIRLLDVNNELVIPTGVKIRLLVEGMDVIHAFAMPAMGVKVDAIPGRINETWLYAKKSGIYYGQCSEICGNGHAYMPIAIRAVTPVEYAKWLAETQSKAKTQKGVDPNDPDRIQRLEISLPKKTSSLPTSGRSVAARPAK